MMYSLNISKQNNYVAMEWLGLWTFVSIRNSLLHIKKKMLPNVYVLYFK